jgi:hypothetical protein
MPTREALAALIEGRLASPASRSELSDGASGIIKAIEVCCPRWTRQRCLAHRCATSPSRCRRICGRSSRPAPPRLARRRAARSPARQEARSRLPGRLPPRHGPLRGYTSRQNSQQISDLTHRPCGARSIQACHAKASSDSCGIGRITKQAAKVVNGEEGVEPTDRRGCA